MINPLAPDAHDIEYVHPKLRGKTYTPRLFQDGGELPLLSGVAMHQPNPTTFAPRDYYRQPTLQERY